MKMKNFTFRIPLDTIYEANRLAAKEHLPLRTLVRSWILQRIDAERVEAAKSAKIPQAPTECAQHGGCEQ
ncbi:MAG: hypothetical protein A4E23_01441 [Methanomethylovorans sp. PtaU1.Bin073]|nr:MAG: hypothetical protein A4E23_01441 [Methanomethylovorans sp. PtaU1.Bin073]